MLAIISKLKRLFINFRPSEFIKEIIEGKVHLPPILDPWSLSPEAAVFLHSLYIVSWRKKVHVGF